MKKSLLISFACHALLIASLVPVLHHVTNYKIPGAKHIIIASIVHEVVPVPKPKVLQGKGLATKPSKPEVKKQILNQQAQDKKLSGEQLNQLVLLLYRAISLHKQYPATSMDLGQQGTVEVSFMATPSGVLNHLQVIRSSGYDNLDQAAISAVKMASPVRGLGKYIHHAKTFSVPIRFD